MNVCFYYATTSEGYHSWDEGEIVRFYEVHPLGSPAHICMTLMLYTGAAKVDAVKLGSANVKGGRIEYRRQKTSKNPSGVLISLPIHPVLAAALAARPVTFTYLETGHNKPRSRRVLEHPCASGAIKRACRCVPHMAYEKQSAAVSPRRVAHPTKSWRLAVTLAMAQKYCETFGRRDMADSAFLRFTGTKAEQNLTNHPERFVKKQPNTL